MAASPYTRQTFQDSAKRRIAEAWVLLHVVDAAHLLSAQPDISGAPSLPRRWSADGAVVCALLAAECALKATLLFGYQTDRIDALPPSVQTELFEGSSGHNISLLWLRQQSALVATAARHVEDAVQRLVGVDRYRHRYGVRRPKPQDAEPHVHHATMLVDWMTQVLMP